LSVYGKQRQEASTLDRHRQHPLITGLGAGQTSRHDLGVLGDVLLEQIDILVVDLLPSSLR
jgi:hypothetical protein